MFRALFSAGHLARVFKYLTNNSLISADLELRKKTLPAHVQSRAFTPQRQVTGKRSSKNFYLQGYLKNLGPRTGENAAPLSHPPVTHYLHVPESSMIQLHFI